MIVHGVEIPEDYALDELIKDIEAVRNQIKEYFDVTLRGMSAT